ncbi:hypothetical protein [Streptomyces aureus]
MTATSTEGPCQPWYRTLSMLALADPEDHVRELTDWMEHASARTEAPSAQSDWDDAYRWLRLAQGLRTITFDMSYDDGGMCSAGIDFDGVWTEMMEGWQLHHVRLGYLRAALEGFVRLLHPDAADPQQVIEAAGQQLHHRAEAWPLHAREVAEPLGGYSLDPMASGGKASVAAGVVQAIALHENAVQGRAGIPEPATDADARIFAAGHAEVCATKEACSVLLLGIQLLMAAANENRVAVFDDKYLLDGKWVPDSSGGSHWVDEEMPYSEYLAVLHLEPGEPPEL